MAGIIVDEVEKEYFGRGGRSFLALDRVSMFCSPGETVAILGESGSGKSTLARVIIGLETPHKGMVSIDGNDLSKLSSKNWLSMRKTIQGVFQDAGGTLNPSRSTYGNVSEALINLTTLSSRERKSKIIGLMHDLDLDITLLDIPARRLSGGEQRRLSLVRALSVDPAYLVLDEITSGLDLISADNVAQLLQRCQERFGCGIVFITHDINYAYRLATRIYVMESGRIARVGSQCESLKTTE